MLKKAAKYLSSRSPQQIFLVLAIPACVIFTFVIPPLNGWDESTHFLRAYQVSEGGLLPERFNEYHAGGRTPVNIVQLSDAAVVDVMEAAQSNLQKKTDVSRYGRFLFQNQPTPQRVDKRFAGSAVYSPVSYLAPSTGIAVARQSRSPVISYVYLGRLFNVAVVLAIIYFAIKLIPRGKWVIVAIAMIPTNLTAAASFSPDALVNAASLLLVALFVKALLGDRKVSKSILALIAASVVVLALTKQTYATLAVLPLFLPVKVYGSWKRYLGWNALFLGLALAVTFGWYSLVDDISQYSYLETRPTVNIDSEGQIQHIVSNPLEFAGILGWRLFGHSNAFYSQMAGFLTWKGILMPFVSVLLVYISIILAYMTALRDGVTKRPNIKKLQKLVTAGGPILLGLGSIAAINVVFYLAFNEVGADEIEGVTGRYFVPFVALLLPWVLLMKSGVGSFVSFDKSKLSLLFALLFIAQTTVAIFVVVATNYIPGMQFV